VLPVLNEEQNEVSLILVQMEPSRNTETDVSDNGYDFSKHTYPYVINFKNFKLSFLRW
jgi:hypothetical protein